MTPAPSDSTPEPLIFVSHASRDKLVADAICARLEQQGIRCWIAPRDVDPGRDYSDQIVEALEKSTLMVMVFSSGSNTSRHVKSEIDRAFSLGQVIVPFRVEDIEPEKGLAYYLSKTHWLDAVNPPLEQHIDRLARLIQKISDPDAPPIPPPAPSPAATRGPAGNKLLWWVAGIFILLTIAALGLLFHRSRAAEERKSVSPVAAGHSTPAPSLPGQAPVANRAASPGIEGRWLLVEARSLAGNPYHGAVRFSKRGDRYDVAWQTTGGDYTGIGLVRGDRVCVGWSTGSFGVVLYKIGTDGTLDGTWSVKGSEAATSGVETATGGTPGKLVGRYLVVGSNPDAQNQYRGQLEITQTGKTYRLHWTTGDASVIGVGLRIDDDLFVAWGGPEPFGVVSYIFNRDRAQGWWTQGGASEVGRENLVKQLTQ